MKRQLRRALKTVARTGEKGRSALGVVPVVNSREVIHETRSAWGQAGVAGWQKAS